MAADRSAKGCIYVLANPAYPGLLKVGGTARRAAARAAELSSSTGVPEPFRVIAWRRVYDWRNAEQRLHEILKKYRRRDNREFFEVSAERAVQLLAIVADEFPTSSSARDGDGGSSIHHGRVALVGRPAELLEDGGRTIELFDEDTDMPLGLGEDDWETCLVIRLDGTWWELPRGPAGEDPRHIDSADEAVNVQLQRPEYDSEAIKAYSLARAALWSLDQERHSRARELLADVEVRTAQGPHLSGLPLFNLYLRVVVPAQHRTHEQEAELRSIGHWSPYLVRSGSATSGWRELEDVERLGDYLFKHVTGERWHEREKLVQAVLRHQERRWTRTYGPALWLYRGVLYSVAGGSHLPEEEAVLVAHYAEARRQEFAEIEAATEVLRRSNE